MTDSRRVQKILKKEKVQEFIIGYEADIITALKAIAAANQRTVFIVDDSGKLSAVLTDGDVRRWIIKGGSLHAHAIEAANTNPIYVTECNIDSAEEYVLNRAISAVPVVNELKEILGVVISCYAPKEIANPVDVPVVIMAGGKGTRLYPYTKILPKPLIPIGEIPISEHIVNRFNEAGCHDFFFIVNYKKNMIKAYYNESEREYKITFIDEDIPLGTGGGVSLLRGKISSTFILTNCDTIIEEDFSKILKEHKEKHNLITMVCSLRNYEVPYGVVEIGANGTILSMQEKPSMSYFTNTGTYIVEPEVIDMIEPGKYIGFPDVIQKLKESGKNVGVFPINENAWLDMGQFDTMENMKQKLNIKD